MRLSRRAAIRSGGAIALGGLAGCLGDSSGQTVDSLPAPTIGPTDAPVLVQGFEDFMCPHCATFALQVLPDIEQEYIDEGVVQYEHHDFPLPIGDWSWKAASAARSVQDNVGNEAFFEFTKGMYRNINQYSIDIVEQLAEDVGADPATVAGDASSLTYKPVLEADRQLGEQQGVQGTPTVFVNGTMTDSPAFDSVASAIEAEL
jgi:protein-disulfide isomerase